MAYHAVIPGCTDYNVTVARLEANAAFYLGMKFHADTDATKLTDDKYKPFMEYMNEKKLPALLHTWGKSAYDGVDEIEKLSALYPDAIFICGHSFHDDWKNGAELVKSRPNLMCELTAVMDNCGAIEMLAGVVGSDRILFGTDNPWFDTHHGIGAVLSADITDDDRRNIFYLNGERLLKKLGRR